MLLVLAACGGGVAALTPMAPVVDVSGAGSHPRRVVTIGLTSGTVEWVELDSKLRVDAAITDTTLDTHRRAIDFPTIRNRVRLEVMNADAGGGVVAFEVESSEVLDDVVDGRVRAAVSAELGASKGLRGTYRVARDGTVSDVVLAAGPDRRAPELRQRWTTALQDSGAVFPAQPIGVGAVWRVRSRVKIEGTLWHRVVTYTLRDLDARRATVRVVAEMHAPSQALRVEPTATSQLSSGKASTTGEIDVPLTAVARALRLTGTMELNVLVTQRRLRISSSVRNETWLTSRPATQ